MSSMLSKNNAKAFALAGNATITLQSGVTGRHYTYKITKHKENDNLFFVKCLYGPDNTSDYRYIGCYYSDTKVFNPYKEYKEITKAMWPRPVRVAAYFFENIDNIPDKLYVYHEGKCGKCGRKLTTPESIERGLGPECYKEIDNG